MSDGEAPDQNFEVDKVLKHKLFDKMVEKALRSEVKFSPQSIEARESEHSKYAYLTVWEDFGIKDRTWEPEENFGENHRAIVKYKKKKNLPMEHEKIKKTYGREVWRHLGIAADHVHGIGYLMTKEEREKLKNEEEKLKKKVDKKREERMAKLAEISNKEIEKDQNRKQRQRMITPEDPEEVAKKPRKKKEKLMEMSPRSEELENESSSRSFEPSPPTTSESHQNVDVLVEKTIPTATPGITRLDPNTPRIQKISPSKNVSSMSEENQSLESISTCSSSSLVFKFANIDGEQVGTVLKRAEEEEAEEDEEMMEVQSVTESAISTEEISTQEEEEEEEIQEESQEDTEISDEDDEDGEDMDVAEAQQEYDALEHQLLTEFPVKIEVKRRYAEFPGSLSNRLLRKCQSTEMLNERWNDLSEMEIFAKNFEQAVIVDEVQIHENVLREQSPPMKFDDFIEIPTDEQLEEEEQEYQEILAKNRGNIEKVMKSQEEFQPGFYQVLDGLVEAFSTDDHLRFVEIFKEGFPAGSEYNALRYAAIVIILAHCDHRLWTADARGFPLFESDISMTQLDTIRNQEKECSEEHRKCAWMRVFLTLIPDPMRFLETSGQCFHGWQGDDGPFRDDAYHWCMRNGAECQKQLFFEFSKPIGIQEDRDGDYMVDAMHLLAVQNGKAERIGLYMSTGGLDINALATHIPTNRVYRLVEYLELWVQTNVVERGADEDSVLYRHYKQVLEMVREAGDVLEELTENRLEMLILQRMRGRYRICSKLTYAHILRCSPMNNVSNLGDGTHQVLTCLFSPGSIGLRDGVYNETTQEVLSTEELALVFAAKQKVDRFRHVVSQRKGQLVVALLRVDVHYETEKDEHCRAVPPTFQFVHSDQDFRISKLSILRQSVDLSASEADIALDELKMMSSPGEKYYRCLEREDEQKLILPGNAHIEVTAEVDKPISFVVQAFFVKRE